MAATPRVRIRPEPELLPSALAVAAMGVAALMYAANAVWLVVCLVVALAGGGAAAAARRLRLADVAAEAPAPLHAGVAGAVPLRLQAPAGLPDLRLDAGGAAAAAALAPGVHRLAAPLPPLRRGIHRIRRIRLASAWPLGVIRCERWIAVDVEVVVAPLPATDAQPPAGDGGDHGRGGPLPEDFAGHRPYRPGDPPRGIDWRAAARGHGWLSTVWDGGGGGTERLRFADIPGDDEARLAVLARWVEDATARGAAFAMDLPAAALPAGSGEAHRRRCLRALAAHPEAP